MATKARPEANIKLIFNKRRGQLSIEECKDVAVAAHDHAHAMLNRR